ncbi:MAG: hypothetical protein HC818_03800 [Synechococcaceae cyanobacterium RM1_1_27]|nr:hypothetical protein [Synechococcaceae cyanobacterium RM1_1_27]
MAPLPPDLTQLQTTIMTVAVPRQQDCLALLQMLRLLEECHRDIRDRLFLNSLPSSRHELYTLLQDLEEMGDWPQIPRTRIDTFLELLKAEVDAMDPLPPSGERKPSHEPISHPSISPPSTLAAELSTGDGTNHQGDPQDLAPTD